MSKVRINDLARELEVKSRAILDTLPLVGVTEKKTHSSSLEEHEAEKVRVYIRSSAGGPAASFFCVIARSTSPGREMFERSNLVFISSSPRSVRELDLPAGDEPSAEDRIYTRTFSASCSSRELECVFFSVTPTSGSVSRIALL